MSAEMGALVTWLGSGVVTLGQDTSLPARPAGRPDAHPGPTMTGVAATHRPSALMAIRIEPSSLRPGSRSGPSCS